MREWEETTGAREGRASLGSVAGIAADVVQNSNDEKMKDLVKIDRSGRSWWKKNA